MEYAWNKTGTCARKEQGRRVLTHPTASKANVPNKEVTNMPFEHEYGDSAPNFKTECYANGGAA